MRRAQAILAIVALLATPLALLARAPAAMPGCNGMCCLLHGKHPVPAQAQSRESQSAEVSCPRGTPGCVCMMTNRTQLDYGLLAPMAPTTPSPHANISVPDVYRRGVPANAAILLPGFPSARLQPPRN